MPATAVATEQLYIDNQRIDPNAIISVEPWTHTPSGIPARKVIVLLLGVLMVIGSLRAHDEAYYRPWDVMVPWWLVLIGGVVLFTLGCRMKRRAVATTWGFTLHTPHREFPASFATERQAQEFLQHLVALRGGNPVQVEKAKSSGGGFWFIVWG